MTGRPEGWHSRGPEVCSFRDRIGLYDANAAATVGRALRLANATDIWSLSDEQLSRLKMGLVDLAIEGLSEGLVDELVKEHLADQMAEQMSGTLGLTHCPDASVLVDCSEEPAWVREQWSAMVSAQPGTSCSSDDDSSISPGSDTQELHAVDPLSKAHLTEPKAAVYAKRMHAMRTTTLVNDAPTGESVMRQLRSARSTLDYAGLVVARATRVHDSFRRALTVEGVEEPDDPMAWAARFEHALDEVRHHVAARRRICQHCFTCAFTRAYSAA